MQRTRTVKFIFLVIIVIFISCSKEIIVDIPVKDYKLVVNSTISPFIAPNPQTVFAKVNRSTHITDTASNTILSDATVCLFGDGEVIDTLLFVDSLGIYVLNRFWFPNQGVDYALKAEHSGYKTVTASTKIPEQVKIIDTVVTPMVMVNEAGDIFNEVALTFKDPPNEKNYYEIVLSVPGIDYYSNDLYYRLSSSDKLISRENYYPPLERFDIEKPKYLLFSDVGIDGEQYCIKFNYKPPRAFDGINGNYLESHIIYFQLRNVPFEYYAFKTAWIQQTNSQIENVLYGGTEPQNIYTNIENGYGLFSGFNYDDGSIFIDEIKY